MLILINEAKWDDLKTFIQWESHTRPRSTILKWRIYRFLNTENPCPSFIFIPFCCLFNIYYLQVRESLFERILEYLPHTNQPPSFLMVFFPTQWWTGRDTVLPINSSQGSIQKSTWIWSSISLALLTHQILSSSQWEYNPSFSDSLFSRAWMRHRYPGIISILHIPISSITEKRWTCR